MSFDALALKAIKEQCDENREQLEKEGYTVFYTLTFPEKIGKTVIQEMLSDLCKQLGAHQG